MYKSVKQKNSLLLPMVFLLGFLCSWPPAVALANSLDHWSIRAGDTSANGIGYGNGLYLAVGGYEVLDPVPQTTGVILKSADGTTWDPQNYGAGFSYNLYALVYGDALMAVGQNGNMLISADGYDGEQWTPATQVPVMQNTLRAVAYGAGTYVAVGEDGSIVTYRAGEGETLRISGTTAKLTGVAYDDIHGNFVAVGNNGIILTSSDGAGWTILESDIPSDLLGITYGKGIFVAVGYSGNVVTSADGGATWTMRTIGASVDLYGIACGDGIFAAAGWNVDSNSSIVLTSYDGAAWIARYPVLQDALVSVTYGASVFLALGSGGAIIQSDPFLPGDINDDGKVDLEDVILCLRVLMGGNPPEVRLDYVRSQIDPDGDGKIGLQDAAYILQKTAGLR